MTLRKVFTHGVFRIPLLGGALRRVARKVRANLERQQRAFPGSTEYWRKRYEEGGNSGPGSRGKLAEFKAEFLNAFVADKRVERVIELGCGDGYQLTFARYPRYVGYDISEEALARCRRTFSEDATKRFVQLPAPNLEKGDLAISLDVIFHLVEDDTYDAYLRSLFSASTRYVVIYSSNTDITPPHYEAHMRNRRFTDWVEVRAPEWELIEHVANRHPMDGDAESGSIADFFVYEKIHEPR